MTLEDLFKRYGCTQNTMDERIYLNHTRANRIDNLNTIAFEDNHAKNEINMFLAYAEALKEYRQTLFDRAQEFYTANYKLLLKIVRNVDSWKKKVTFTVTVQKIYELQNTRPETVLTETYSGTERHKAFKRFEELQKEYPNIETEKDIEKKYWER